jgi:ribosomal protein S18 acetylase RimI-like enzyme
MSRTTAALTIREFQPQDEEAVIALWERCGLVRPWNDPRKDISRKLKVRPDLFLVGITDGKVVATVMAGYDGHRGWINYLSVAPEERRRGYGRTMMREAEDRLRGAGCPKINLQIRRTNADVIAFYASLGYVQDEVVSMGRRLEVDQVEADA